MLFRNLLKQIYLRSLFMLPHNSVYSFHCVSGRSGETQKTGRWMTEDHFLRFVKEHGPYLPLTELITRTRRDRHAALTFDDGLEDVYTVAYKILKPMNIPFTIFPLTGMLDTPGYMTTEQLKEMAADPLVTVGSHGINHLHFSREDRTTQTRELADSKETLEALTGKPCTVAAYPYGQYNFTTLLAMKDAGFEWGMAVKGRPILFPKKIRPYEVPRLSVDRTTENLYYYS